MQLITSFAVVAAAAMALFAATPAQATDYRQLVKYNGGSATDFCNSWRCACVNYVPKDTSLSFSGTICEPGDYHGQNPNSEAKVVCLFTNGSKGTLVNKHIASAVGATFV